MVLVHELGHFVMAKLAGIRVEEFGIGFPPRLVGAGAATTEYSLNWIPLGGFVRMLGEDGDSEAEKMQRARPLRGGGRQGDGGRLQSQAARRPHRGPAWRASR